MRNDKTIKDDLHASRAGTKLVRRTIYRDTGGHTTRWVLIHPDGSEIVTTRVKGMRVIYAINQTTIFDRLWDEHQDES